MIDFLERESDTVTNEMYKNDYPAVPGCFGSGPNFVEQAESCCNDCYWIDECLGVSELDDEVT